MNKIWHTLTCLDNPEEIVLRQGKDIEDRKALFIEAQYCKGWDSCKSDEEILNFKQREFKFRFYSNLREYQPNMYGE